MPECGQLCHVLTSRRPTVAYRSIHDGIVRESLSVAETSNQPLFRTYFIYRHVCDGGEVGCSSRRIATTHRLYVRSDRQRNAPRSPRPFGLRPGRSSAALPSSTISTYGLRRAPCIRSVLAA